MTNTSNTTKAFIKKIQCLYYMEKQLEDALPKMAEAAMSEDLREGLLDHLEETRGHSERLEQIFDLLDEVPMEKECRGIEGIIADGEEDIESEPASALRDAMIAASGRKAEHYEMACYLGAIEEAKHLNLKEIGDLLKETLDEEEAADKKLTAAMKKGLKETLGE